MCILKKRLKKSMFLQCKESTQTSNQIEDGEVCRGRSPSGNVEDGDGVLHTFATGNSLGKHESGRYWLARHMEDYAYERFIRLTKDQNHYIREEEGEAKQNLNKLKWNEGHFSRRL
jgi:hypothetical protein